MRVIGLRGGVKERSHECERGTHECVRHKGMMWWMGAVIFVTGVMWGQTPADVVEFFRGTAEALANKDTSGFMEKFDPKMPGFAKLRDDVETLVTRADVGSAIEVVKDDGDDQKRVLELDWLLEIEKEPHRRLIVKCSIERRGKKWKITALEPIDFFRK